MRENWQRLKQIVGSALELPPEKRPAFVRELCGDDAALLAQVQSLLAHDQAADSILEYPPTDGLLTATWGDMTGRRLGAYRIVSQAGQGGMAVVFLAQRDDHEFAKRVAIKMVKPGADTEKILRRFRNERQTLAALDHPNIVKLLDGGTTEEGLPYLIMEFVEGLPIDEFCDKNKLTVAERIQLFRTVCAAVDYAHGHQVIHRDIKPRNILITADGIPRLLDFGIAKVLSPEPPSGQASTVGNWHPMTPDYASPEQVKGLPVTCASDIYSLGVLLYELLTGHRPYQTDSSSWVEIERAICEKVPVKPSVSIRKREGILRCGESDPVEAMGQIAAARGVSIEKLEKLLRGDLDTIVMMALRKESERRYASARDFSKDLQRHLSGLAVKAEAPTYLYRSKKFLGRHREAVGAVTILAFLAAVGYAWGIHRQARLPIDGQISGSNQTVARPSVAVLGFKNLSGRPDIAWVSTALEEMLTVALAAGENLRLVPEETVARAKIELGLPDEQTLSPETLRRIRADLGSDYVVSGSYLYTEDGGIRVDLLVQEASGGQILGAISETGKAQDLTDLASRSGARIRTELGVPAVSPFETSGIESSFPKQTQAMKSYAEGLVRLRIFDALSAKDLFERAVTADPTFPMAHMALAEAYQTLGYDRKALEESRKALTLSDKLSRQDYLQVESRYFENARDWDEAIETNRALFSFFPDNVEYGLNLARTQTEAGKGKEALETLAAVEKATQQSLKDPRIDLARAEAAASLGDNRLRREAAEDAARKAAKEGAKLLLAQARTQECRALANLGKNEDAMLACNEGRDLYKQAGDKGGLAKVLHQTAEVPLNTGDLPKAEKLYQEALALTRQIGDKQGIGRECGNLALIYKYRGDLASAQALMEEALRNQEEAGDKNGMAIQTVNLGNVLRLQGLLQQALAYYRKSLSLSQQVGNKSSAGLALDNIGETLVLKGDLAGAVRSYQQVLAIHHDRGEKFYYAGALVSLGNAFRLQGSLGKARSTFEEALSIQKQIGEKDGVAETQLALARLDSDQKEARKAEALVREALPAFEQLRETDDQIAAQGLLARVLADQGKIASAQQVDEVAAPLAEKSHNAIVRMPFSLDRAHVLTAAKEFTAAEKLEQAVLEESGRLGVVRFQLESSLTLAETLAAEKGRFASRQRFRDLQRAAANSGFGLIAQKATAAYR